MSEYTLKRINFADKDDSVSLNSNSKFVLTANNINEIKSVVNNLCDEVENRLRFNQIFKYTKFNVPSTLKENCNYTFEFELSESPDFENSVAFTLENDFSKFSIFENDIWNNLDSNRKIIYNDRNKALKFDISNIVSDQFKPYFGRCRWINRTTLEIQEYQGFALGIFEYNDKQFDDKVIKEFYIVGETTLNEKDNKKYNAYYKDNYGNVFKVTEKTTFSTLLNVCSIENNSLIVPKLHTIKNEIIKAEFTYNSIKYTTYLNLVLNPILLESIKINGDIDTIKDTEEKSFTISAIYSDGSKIDDVTEKCDIILTMENCNLSGNIISGKENSCFDEYGSLVIVYNDDDFEEESISVVKYINYKITKARSLEIKKFPQIITGNEKEDELTYSITLTYDDGSEKDVTNDVDINLIDCNEIECKNGKILIKGQLLNEKTITCIINYVNNICKNEKASSITSFKIEPKYLIDINLQFYNSINQNIIETNEKTYVEFKIIGTYNDGHEEEVNYNYVDVKLLSNSNANILKDEKRIIINKFEYQELLLLVFKYEDGKIKFEKSKYLNVKPIKLQKLIVESDELEINGTKNQFFAIAGVEKIFNINATYSNGNTIPVNEFCKIEIAAGDTSLIESINKNKVIFKNPEYKEESITLMVSYEDADFQSEIKSAFFVVSVFQID
jgi:hypothetical protein